VVAALAPGRSPSGSSLQIALFAAPVLVFASDLRAEPMDLRFSTLEVVAVLLSVLLARMVCEDGESNWLEGLMLLMVYAILALAFFFLPGRGELHGASHDRSRGENIQATAPADLAPAAP
jgi:hypothetical protein